MQGTEITSNETKIHKLGTPYSIKKVTQKKPKKKKILVILQIKSPQLHISIHWDSYCVLKLHKIQYVPF